MSHTEAETDSNRVFSGCMECYCAHLWMTVMATLRLFGFSRWALPIILWRIVCAYDSVYRAPDRSFRILYDVVNERF